MLIVDTKNCENIDKALRKYKKKFDKTRVILQLRGREFFTKPSIKKRNQKLKAIYRQKFMSAEI
ncbi:MAG: 30S ribosomal protein S21 [Chitinophagaceae bacterium]